MSPDADRALLAEAARAGGDAAMAFFRRNPKKWDKPGEAGPVTEADLAVDALLTRNLRAARPGYGWLSEETPDDAARLDHEAVFIVDPIDGTRAFIAGDTGWCVALAVARRGAITAAAAWFPARRDPGGGGVGSGAGRALHRCDGPGRRPRRPADPLFGARRSGRRLGAGGGCATGRGALAARRAAGDAQPAPIADPSAVPGG